MCEIIVVNIVIPFLIVIGGAYLRLSSNQSLSFSF